MIKQQFQTLLSKEMTRKNFLQYSGGLFLAAIGVTAFVRVLLSDPKGLNQSFTQQTSGYGSSSYGE